LKLGNPFLNESKENERKRVEDFNKINGMSKCVRKLSMEVVK
jgi:hypothetical protein